MLQLLDRYLAQEQNLLNQTILAPVQPNGRVAVKLPNGSIYTFRVKNYSGWGVFSPRNIEWLTPVREAYQWEQLMYLRSLPLLRSILISPVTSGVWLAMAWNRSDAKQRRLPEMFTVRLVEQGQALDRIAARWDGLYAWWESLDSRDPKPQIATDARIALSDMKSVPTDLTPEQAIVYSILLEKERESRVTKEERAMRSDLSHLGASLTSFESYGSGYIVCYQDGGTQHEVRVRSDFTVTSAGICLSGRDEDFDLASIVAVMRGRSYGDDNW